MTDENKNKPIRRKKRYVEAAPEKDKKAEEKKKKISQRKSP